MRAQEQMSSTREPDSGGSRPPDDFLRRNWPWMAAAGGLLLLVLLAVRQPLAERLWPQNSAQQALSEADAALARGHLSAADGSGARELYEAALAMDPDRPGPRQGLANVARAALDVARRETGAGNFTAAHDALRLARELSAPRADTDAVAAALREREIAGAGLDELWERAEEAYRDGRLHGANDAALPLYRRILRLDPAHLGALRGRDDAVAELLQQARASLRGGELAEAAALIALSSGFDPGHMDLPDTRARLTEEYDAILALAGEELENGRLERAAELYRALLAMDADDDSAAAGLIQVGRALGRRADRLAVEYRFAEAEAALARARELAPGDGQLRAVAERIEASRALHARVDPAQSPAERRQRVAVLLEEIAAAEARGELLEPPGGNAYDKLHAARSIAPDDPQVIETRTRLLETATDCFERELRSNSLGRAGACLDARTALTDDAGELATARQRLAQRWLAVGDERLGAGELGRATSALQYARETDPSVPGLAEFSERLRTASASGP